MAKKEVPVINAEECVACESCVNECPAGCLEIVDDVAKLVRPEDCTSCGTCAEVCPSEAITLEEQEVPE
jgi:NAD-dependent dihydropyrimidine dehydrogenase PreA subunit